MPKKVMIIDDDKEFLGEMASLLDSSGYKAIPVGEAGLVQDAIKHSRPDVILMDLKLGGESGFSIALTLKGMKEAHDIPIIAITLYYNERETRNIMSDCNIKMCLFKPLDPEKLIAAIEKA